MSENWKSVGIRIPEEDYLKLLEVSKESGLAMSRICVHAIHKLLVEGSLTISETWTWREKV